MSYVKTTWVEHDMTEQAKIDALNHAELQYEETYAEVLAHRHDDLYYTKSQADARFFGSAHQGAGSGMNAGTLDGYTVDQIIASSIPQGLIVMSLLEYSKIPAGFSHFAAMNGRHPIGANDSYPVNTSGGTTNVTMTDNPGIGSCGHSLTAAEMPAHTHQYAQVYNPPSSVRKYTEGAAHVQCRDCGNQYSWAYGYSEYTGSGNTHYHSVSIDIYNIDVTPPNVALTFMKKD